MTNIGVIGFSELLEANYDGLFTRFRWPGVRGIYNLKRNLIADFGNCLDYMNHAAQKLLPTVELDYDLRVKISEVCSQLDVDGLRGDIVTNRAAKAHAAYNGRNKVNVEDISKIITLCLRHRLRKDPLEVIDSGDKVSKVFKEIFELED